MGIGTEQKNKGEVARLKDIDFKMTLMKVEDIEEINRIEKQSFSLPWSKDDFREIVLSEVYKAYVARGSANRIYGYIVFYSAADEGHVMNVVANPMYRRKGVAQTMLVFVHDTFRKDGLKSCYLELRRSNYPAYRLYKKMGYVYVGLRKQYYADNNEDAIIMRKVLV